MKCLYINQTYITLDNTANKISKNIFLFLAIIFQIDWLWCAVVQAQESKIHTSCDESGT